MCAKPYQRIDLSRLLRSFRRLNLFAALINDDELRRGAVSTRLRSGAIANQLN
jgi:hypothetical protein